MTAPPDPLSSLPQLGSIRGGHTRPVSVVNVGQFQPALQTGLGYPKVVGHAGERAVALRATATTSRWNTRGKPLAREDPPVRTEVRARQAVNRTDSSPPHCNTRMTVWWSMAVEKLGLEKLTPYQRKVVARMFVESLTGTEAGQIRS